MLRTEPAIHTIKSSFPWYKKAISRSASYAPPEKRNWVQGIGSKTIGGVIGGGLVTLSLADLAYNLIYKRDEGSIFKKLLTPVLGTILGVIGIGISKLPKDVFAAELIRNGISNVLNKVKILSKQATNIEEVANLFSDEDKNILKEKVESVILAAWPKIIDFLPDTSSENTIVSSLKELHPENVTLERLKGIFQGHGEDALSTFVETNPIALRRTLAELFNEENKHFQDRLQNLICSVNKLIQPTGLALDLTYNPKNNLMEIYLVSCDLFSHKCKRELYNPFFVISAKPSYIFTALEHLQRRLKYMDSIKNQALESLEQNDGNMTDETNELLLAMKENIQMAISEVVASLSSGLFDMIGRTRAGYFILDKKTKERLGTIYINRTIDDLVLNDYISLNELRKGVEEIQRGPETIKVERSFVTNPNTSELNKTEDNEAFLAVSIGSSILHEGRKASIQTDGHPSPGYSLPEANTASLPPTAKQSLAINNLTDILKLLNFNLKKEMADEDEITRLKICLIKAYVLSYLEKGTDKPQESGQFRKIMYQLGDLVKDYDLFSKEDIRIKVEPKGNRKYEIPEDLLNIELFLRALGIQSISKSDLKFKAKLQGLDRLFSLLDGIQARKLRDALEEKLYPTRTIPLRTN